MEIYYQLFIGYRASDRNNETFGSINFIHSLGRCFYILNFGFVLCFFIKKKRRILSREIAMCMLYNIVLYIFSGEVGRKSYFIFYDRQSILILWKYFRLKLNGNNDITFLRKRLLFNDIPLILFFILMSFCYGSVGV